MAAAAAAPARLTVARDAELMKLARSACEIRHYMPEEYICMQGQPASAIHVVVSGDVRLTRSVGAAAVCRPFRV